MHALCATYAPGNTDLAWTRLTPWRALLAAALDQYETTVTSASVTAERISPSADLLVSLADRPAQGEGARRKTPRARASPRWCSRPSRGRSGSRRLDGKLATISSPGQPDRPIALKRLEIPALLAEELRRLDEDDVYAAVAKAFAKKRLS